MKRKYILIATGFAVLAGLSGCGSSGVLDRKRPDEFAVTRAAPLAVPTEFTLAAPQPGAPRPQEAEAKTQVLDAIFGGTAPRQ